MQRERVLITVKTYPTLSKSHIELVCTAGLREDGSWIRVYPIPFRLLDQGHQFPKWGFLKKPVGVFCACDFRRFGAGQVHGLFSIW